LRVAPEDLANHLFALQTLRTLHDNEGATKLAAGIEKLFASRVDAWKALAEFYAEAGDRAGAARADERLRALGAKK
jgi:hypothetical protein